MISFFSILLGIASAALIPIVLNKMPAKCFCDYDETPDEHHNPPRAGKWSIVICTAILIAVFQVLTARLGTHVESIFAGLFCTVLLMIALSDIRYCIIPDELIIAGCILATVSVFPTILNGNNWSNRLAPVLGATIGFGIIYAINLLGRILYNKDALGMGDLKLMVICGMVCGPIGTVMAMLIGLLTAGIWFAFCIVLKKIQSDSYMPLGPFLIFGTIFTLSFRPMIDAFLAWYISLI